MVQGDIQGMLGVSTIKEYEKYLGLPSFHWLSKILKFCTNQRKSLD